MRIHGIRWVGSRTQNYQEMREFVSEKLDLEITQEQEGAVVFGFSDGSAFEIFKPHDTAHSFFEHPVPGFIVDDVTQARAELEEQGVSFIGEIHFGNQESWGTAWSHFRAPDGHVYALISRTAPELTTPSRDYEELRFCLKVPDFDQAVTLFRDGLGMPVVDSWTHPGGQRGALFGVVPGAIEIFDEAQWAFVDEAEVGSPLETDHALRLEVSNLEEIDRLARALESSGATRIAQVTEVPWEQTCLRMAGPDGQQLTIFLLPEEERKIRKEARNSLPR